MVIISENALRKTTAAVTTTASLMNPIHVVRTFAGYYLVTIAQIIIMFLIVNLTLTPKYTAFQFHGQYTVCIHNVSSYYVEIDFSAITNIYK